MREQAVEVEEWSDKECWVLENELGDPKVILVVNYFCSLCSVLATASATQVNKPQIPCGDH